MGLLLRMLMQFLLFVGVTISSAVAPAAAQAVSTGCVGYCGNVSIPYPFGIKGSNPKCFRDKNFSLNCNDTSSSPTPKLGTFSVANISVEENQLKIQMRISKLCFDEHGKSLGTKDRRRRFGISKFSISNDINTFVAVGCDTYAFLRGFRNSTVSYSTGCMSTCNNISNVVSGSCSGIGCCKVEFPNDLTRFTVSVRSFNNHTNVSSFNPCSYAFLVQKDQFNFSSDYLRIKPLPETLPVVLDWFIRSGTCEEAKNKPDFACKGNFSDCDDFDSQGYRCRCKQGYKGNPYYPEPGPAGCQDVNECADSVLNDCTIPTSCANTQGNYTCSCPRWKRGDGRKHGEGCVIDISLAIKVAIGIGTGFFAVLIGCFCLYFVFQQRKVNKLKEKFFKKNGGLILQQQLSKQKRTTQTTKIFTGEELKAATNNYDESRIIGQGGFGTVYKGFLPDNTIVAIKKSKTVDQSQIEQFINEMIVLSQINHRNVVKLLGCCLETQVPLLVYEFVVNGTLFDYIHHESMPSTIPWETCLRLAAETAEALSYLHSAVSTPIIHRDVKPMNILLDEKYMAKVSDFGASRLVPLDQSQIGTMVQGTVGYLDPEYLLTSQLTEKSDVYSFGVVLTELLTRKKAFSVDGPEKERSLVNYFLSSLKEDRLFEVLKNDLVNEGNKEQLHEVAQLAKRCLKMKGEERPTMREVAMELEGLRRMSNHPWVNVEVKLEETECLLGETSDAYTYGGNSNKNTEQDSMRNHILLPLELDGGR